MAGSAQYLGARTMLREHHFYVFHSINNCPLSAPCSQVGDFWWVCIVCLCATVGLAGGIWLGLAPVHFWVVCLFVLVFARRFRRACLMAVLCWYPPLGDSDGTTIWSASTKPVNRPSTFLSSMQPGFPAYAQKCSQGHKNAHHQTKNPRMYDYVTFVEAHVGLNCWLDYVPRPHGFPCWT